MANRQHEQFEQLDSDRSNDSVEMKQQDVKAMERPLDFGHSKRRDKGQIVDKYSKGNPSSMDSIEDTQTTASRSSDIERSSPSIVSAAENPVIRGAAPVVAEQ